MYHDTMYNPFMDMGMDIVNEVLNVCVYTNVYLEFLLWSSGHHLVVQYGNLLLCLLLGHHTWYRWACSMFAVQNPKGSVVVWCFR